MTPTAEVNRRIQESLSRIARATSVIRVRGEDAAREDVNGGSLGELVARIEKAADDIEKAANKVSAVLT